MSTVARTMTIEKSISLRHPLIWQAGALLMLALTVWATLTPHLPKVTVEFQFLAWDKAQHAIVYACLMWWCSQAFQKRGPLCWAAILLLMGCTLELLQHQTAARHMEFDDMVANGVGVLVGYLLWLTPLGRGLRTVELWFSRDKTPAVDCDS
jgi:hypothetical protein